MSATRFVAVIGKGRNCPPATRELAYQVGRQLASLDDVALICGGLGGVMDAAAEGMTSAGGVAIGLVPAPNGVPPSRHLTYTIRTGLVENFRNIVLSFAADLAVVCPGSHGTLIEGWALIDAGTPLVAVGEHDHRLSGSLPFDVKVESPSLLADSVRSLWATSGSGR